MRLEHRGGRGKPAGASRRGQAPRQRERSFHFDENVPVDAPLAGTRRASVDEKP